MAKENEIARWPKANKAPHGLFHTGGYKPTERVIAPASDSKEHQGSCFALEEEKGDGWKGSGATKPVINEKRPSL